MIQQMLAIWSLVPLRFLKPAWTSANSKFMYCWSLAWRILSIKKAREFQKNIYFCFIDYAKAFDCVDHNKLWKILREKCRRFLEITSEMTQNIRDIRDAHKRHTLWPEGEELCTPASSRIIYIQPLWAGFQKVWPNLFSTAHVHKCYRIAKGSEIPAYCRVCPEPLS